MLYTTLVPLDGSSLAERALPSAAALARAGGKLILFEAVPLGPELSLDYEIALHEARSYLASVKTWLATYESLAHVETSVALGDAGPAIIAAAAERHVDVIAMSTHGRSGLGRLLYGSVADAVLRHAAVPVLLFPAACERIWGASPPGHTNQGPAGSARAPGSGATARPPRILVPLDGSALALEALPAASPLAETLGGEVILVQVLELTSPAYAALYPWLEPDRGAALAEVRRALAGVAAPLRARGFHVTTVAEVGEAAATIAAIAREQQVDLIVMATHGRGGVARLVLGSVATGLVQQSPVPLLLVRPAALREPAADVEATTEEARTPDAMV
jgi:nucleotide-binding universal stress UspA family protein